jgi:bifunctional UDP-N-acetylglucosamine pyrophosphorylase/glucosamine-1-phosphate N-acetyltransferase
MHVNAIVLAAGEGTRMRSTRPKPLHRICGRSMVMHVIHALEGLTLQQTVVVVGHGAERVTKSVQEEAPTWAGVTFTEQLVQRGTGDAAMVGLRACGEERLDDASTVLILPGDTPLIRAETIRELVHLHETSGNAATVLSTHVADPTGYGRILHARDGRVTRIVEHKDATEEEQAITEINTGIYAFRRDVLGPALRRIGNNNSQSEYYLTDVIEVLAEMGHTVQSLEAPYNETAGVNDRLQLALAERELRARVNHSWLLSGVTMLDPAQAFIDVTVRIGQDVTLFPGVILQGDTVIGDGCEIGPGSHIVDSVIGPRVTIHSSRIEDAEVGADAIVGPFASIEPGASVANGQRTGAFYTGRS